MTVRAIRWMSILSAAVLLLLVRPAPAHAYLEFSSTILGESRLLKWPAAPIRWYARDLGTDGVSASAFQAAVARAFATWAAVPSASIRFEFVGFTGATPLEDDTLSVLGFENTPDLEGVLGSTAFVIDLVTGEIVESDIFLNSAFTWSTAADGDSTRFDLESVVLHEIGHFVGLAHSALGETEVRPGGGRRVLASGAVMFPIAFGRGNTLDRTLQPDDIAGISDLYPSSSFRSDTGVARGRVRRGGRGVLGAHVLAFNLATGAVISGFSLTEEGEFEIGGLTPGPHVIRVEPLDDADIESFFDEDTPLDVDFPVTYSDRLFVAPAGGVGARFDVEVGRR